MLKHNISIAWLKRGAVFALLFIIFCGSFERRVEHKPFVMPMLLEEKGKRSEEIPRTGAVWVEDFDAFLRLVGDEKVKKKAYWKLEWDTGQYEDGGFTLD
ncbi:MAG: hypothetical protein WKI46_01010 [Aquificaceae bacterium]